MGWCKAAMDFCSDTLDSWELALANAPVVQGEIFKVWPDVQDSKLKSLCDGGMPCPVGLGRASTGKYFSGWGSKFQLSFPAQCNNRGRYQ